MDLELDGRVAIVTGASRGIGASIALRLAEEGCAVTLAARDDKLLAQQAESIMARTGTRPHTVAGDLREAATCQRVVEETTARAGRLDILVNNAGATKRGSFLDLGDDDYLDGFALKFHAAVRMCRLAWPHLKAASGCIVNISGIAARTPSAEYTIGGPVNSAVNNFTKAIADQGIADGIRVNAVNPGYIVTDRLRIRVEALAADRGQSFDETLEQLQRGYGIARYGAPEDIARTVAFLCSGLADYIHGATIDVDGGATRGI